MFNTLPSGSVMGSVRYIVFRTGVVVVKAWRWAGLTALLLVFPITVRNVGATCADIRLELNGLETVGWMSWDAAYRRVARIPAREPAHEVVNMARVRSFVVWKVRVRAGR